MDEDFIVSELLSELKSENIRKDQLIKKLTQSIVITIVAAVLSILLTVGGFLVYLNQYDFSSTSNCAYSTVQTAEGVYAVIDNKGNVVGQDLSMEQLQELMEELSNGESICETERTTNSNEKED